MTAGDGRTHKMSLAITEELKQQRIPVQIQLSK